MTSPTTRTANLSDIYQTMLGRYGADHPMTRRALSDARHAGVVIADYVLTGGPIPEDFSGAYRGAIGEAVGNRTVTRESTSETRTRIVSRAAALALGLVTFLLVNLS